eukprot:11322485-Heterocapsa_arctica.AAC.1
MNSKVCVLGNVMRNNPASDQIPVTLSLECPRMVATPSKAIPRWIARHPMFEIAMKELLSQCDATDPYEKLSDQRSRFCCQAPVPATTCPPGSQTSEEKLHWATTLHRAARAGDNAGMKKALGPHRHLLQFMENEGRSNLIGNAAAHDVLSLQNRNGLEQHIADLHRTLLDREAEGIDIEAEDDKSNRAERQRA